MSPIKTSTTSHTSPTSSRLESPTTASHAGSLVRTSTVSPPKVGFGSGVGAGVTEHMDLTSDATLVASALHQARGKGILGGLASLTRLRFEAWLEERMKGPILHKLSIRREVAEAQKSAEEAQNKLKGTQHDGSRNSERYQIDISQMRRQRLLSDLNNLSDLTAVEPVLPAHQIGSPMVPAPPMHITDEQVEALALRAALQLGADDDNDDGSDSGSGESMWSSYRADLYARLPVNTAQEVERRILEIRAVTR